MYDTCILWTIMLVSLYSVSDAVLIIICCAFFLLKLMCFFENVVSEAPTSSYFL